MIAAEVTLSSLLFDTRISSDGAQGLSLVQVFELALCYLFVQSQPNAAQAGLISIWMLLSPP